ncbi:MAG: hypothetical protein WBA74_22805 [Cyclobacteriaceae bacterium]
MNNKFELQRERDFGENISGIFTVLRSQFKTLMGAIVLISGPIILLFSIIVAYIGLGDINALSDGNYDNLDFVDRYLSSLISYGVLWFGNAMVSMVTFSYLKIYRDKENASDITTDMVWQETKKHILPVIAASILSALVIGISALFFFIPAIIFAIYLSMYVPIIVFEDLSVGNAFNKSFQLVSDNFWMTLGLAIVVAIITYFFTLAFTLPSIILTFVWSFNSMDTLTQGEGFAPMSETFTTLFLISGLLANLASMLISVIPNLSIALHYFNLKEKKESSSLMTQISTMGSSETEERESY